MNKILRNELKKFYKEKRLEDGKVGRFIDECIQAIHQEYKLAVQDRNAIVIENNLAELKTVREESRFRQDFPDFASFKKFVKKNKLTLQDLKDVGEEVKEN